MAKIILLDHGVCAVEEGNALRGSADVLVPNGDIPAIEAEDCACGRAAVQNPIALIDQEVYCPPIDPVLDIDIIFPIRSKAIATALHQVILEDVLIRALEI